MGIAPRIVAAALALSSPAVAAAADPEPGGVPLWSTGAGVGTVIFGGDLLVGVTPTSGIPFVRASLERRVGEATWLVLGVAGFYSTTDTEPPASGLSILSDTDSTAWSGRVEAGLRRELTGPRAPFSVSGFLLANVGGQSRERRYVTGAPATEVEEDAEAFVAGLSAGAAVERELTRGLSVRISSALVSTSWAWGEIRTSGQPSRDARTLSASVTLVPSLELRLAF